MSDSPAPPPAGRARRRRARETLQSRPPLQRMLVLHERLQGGAFPNCRRMGEELEVSGKTIQRDLDFMRDRLHLPIAWDAARLGYYYTEAVEGFPPLEVTAGEVLALCVAQKALGQYEGTTFHRQLAAALRKLTHALRDKVSFHWSDAEAAISFHKVGTTEADLQSFETVSQSVLRSRELCFEYRKLGSNRYEPRRLRPYHLGSIENQWYVIGYDLQRSQLRTFALSRMRAVEGTRVGFQRPESFSAEEHFSGSFGVFAGPRRHRIRLQFDAVAGQLVSERSWHPSQKLRHLAAGGVEMTLTLCSLREIERWILSWGTRVRVLAPPELAERIRDEAKRMAASYRVPGQKVTST